MKWLSRKPEKLLLLTVALALVIILNLKPIFAPTYYALGTCHVEMASGGIGFQNEIGKLVEVLVHSGYWNTSTAAISMYSGGGKFTFNSINATTLTLQYHGLTNVQVQGDMGNEIRRMQSGTDFQIQNGDQVVVLWSITFEPTLPILFIMGIVGLIGMFGGPVYAVHKAKQHEYYDALRLGVLFTASGLALFIAWLVA